MDELEWRFLAQRAIEELDEIPLDEEVRSRLKGQLLAALTLPEGSAKSTIRDLLTSTEVLRSWLDTKVDGDTLRSAGAAPADVEAEPEEVLEATVGDSPPAYSSQPGGPGGRSGRGRHIPRRATGRRCPDRRGGGRYRRGGVADRGAATLAGQCGRLRRERRPRGGQSARHPTRCGHRHLGGDRMQPLHRHGESRPELPAHRRLRPDGAGGLRGLRHRGDVVQTLRVPRTGPSLEPVSGG